MSLRTLLYFLDLAWLILEPNLGDGSLPHHDHRTFFVVKDRLSRRQNTMIFIQVEENS